MQIICHDTPEWADQVAARFVEALSTMPTLRMCLPTGATPLPAYARIAEAVRDGSASFRDAEVFLLDEFGGVPADADGRCHVMLRRTLLDLVDLPASRYHRPVPEVDDLETMCADYDRAIDARLDLTLLGIGTNAHIGMNEPGSSPDSPTRRVELAPETTRAAARYFGPVPAPTWGVTIGLGPLRASRTIWLLATGPSKADVVRDVLLEPMSVDRPASLLRAHPHCLFILDRAAAARLPRHLLGRPASPGRSG